MSSQLHRARREMRRQASSPRAPAQQNAVRFLDSYGYAMACIVVLVLDFLLFVCIQAIEEYDYVHTYFAHGAILLAIALIGFYAFETATRMFAFGSDYWRNSMFIIDLVLLIFSAGLVRLEISSMWREVFHTARLISGTMSVSSQTAILISQMNLGDSPKMEDVMATLDRLVRHGFLSGRVVAILSSVIRVHATQNMFKTAAIEIDSDEDNDQNLRQFIHQYDQSTRLARDLPSRQSKFQGRRHRAMGPLRLSAMLARFQRMQPSPNSPQPDTRSLVPSGSGDKPSPPSPPETGRTVSFSTSTAAEAASAAASPPSPTHGSPEGAPPQNLLERVHTLSMSTQSRSPQLKLLQVFSRVEFPDVSRMLTAVDMAWGYNVFELTDFLHSRHSMHDTAKHPIVFTGLIIFMRLDLLATFDIPCEALLNFLLAVEKGYKADNPYHNAYHGADVMQTVHWFLTHGGVADRFHLTPLEMLAAVLSAVVHDLGHPGYTNDFLVRSSDERAITYNDKAVLENFHVAETFRILATQPECDILQQMDRADRLQLRDTMIKMVLGTDMSQHNVDKGLLQAKMDLGNGRFVANTNEDRQFVLRCVLHAADISGVIKPPSLSLVWTELVLEEFFMQGDEEKRRGYAVTASFDRETPSVGKFERGFLKYIVGPFFKLFLDALVPHSRAVRDSIVWNTKYWESVPEDGPWQRPPDDSPVFESYVAMVEARRAQSEKLAAMKHRALRTIAAMNSVGHRTANLRAFSTATLLQQSGRVSKKGGVGQLVEVLRLQRLQRSLSSRDDGTGGIFASNRNVFSSGSAAPVAPATPSKPKSS